MQPDSISLTVTQALRYRRLARTNAFTSAHPAYRSYHEIIDYAGRMVRRAVYLADPEPLQISPMADLLESQDGIAYT